MWPEIVDMELDDFWFQHSLISRFGGINCPPQFYAIRPFLWDGMKDRCYANKPLPIQGLKAIVQQATCEIEPETLTEVLELGYTTVKSTKAAILMKPGSENSMIVRNKLK